MRRRLLRATAASFVLATALTAALPASGGSGEKICAGNFFNSPDGRIKLNDRQGWTGTDQFPVTTKATATTPVGQSVTFTFRWKNVNLVPKTIRVSLFDIYGLGQFKYTFSVNGLPLDANQFNAKDQVFTNVAPGAMTPAVKLSVTPTGGQPSAFLVVSLQGKYGGAAPGVCDQLNARTN